MTDEKMQAIAYLRGLNAVLLQELLEQSMIVMKIMAFDDEGGAVEVDLDEYETWGDACVATIQWQSLDGRVAANFEVQADTWRVYSPATSLVITGTGDGQSAVEAIETALVRLGWRVPWTTSTFPTIAGVNLHRGSGAEEADERRAFAEECRREQAMLAGMGGGCDAYNDAMGWGSEPPDEER